jgi:hypothetical protein
VCHLLNRCYSRSHATRGGGAGGAHAGGARSRSQDIALEPTPVLQRTEQPAGGWKVCRYQMAGYYSARTRVCTTYTTLESVCVQVRPTREREREVETPCLQTAHMTI